MTMEQTELPTITEAQANGILDDIVQTVVQPRDEQGADIVQDTNTKLKGMFGEFAPVVAQMILLSALRGFEVGLVEQLPVGDRTDIVVSALRRVHKPEIFGDCVEDGESYPCKTARVLNLVSGEDPNVPTLEEELDALDPRA